MISFYTRLKEATLHQNDKEEMLSVNGVDILEAHEKENTLFVYGQKIQSGISNIEMFEQLNYALGQAVVLAGGKLPTDIESSARYFVREISQDMKEESKDFRLFLMEFQKNHSLSTAMTDILKNEGLYKTFDKSPKTSRKHIDSRSSFTGFGSKKQSTLSRFKSDSSTSSDDSTPSTHKRKKTGIRPGGRRRS